MKNIILLAALIATLSGCATISATTGSQLSIPEAGDDGTIKQMTGFSDLPAELQQAILLGG